MPVVRKSSVRAALAVIPMALAVVLGTAGLAHATDQDDRAIPHPGNLDRNHDDACTELGGQPLPESVFTFTGGEGHQYLNIESVEGHTVTGIVVKGGPAYNVYVPGEGLEATPQWDNLQSPLKAKKNGGHILPDISHWYACGVPTDKTTPSEKPTTSKSDVPTKSSESTPPETGSSTPTESTPGTPGETSSSAPSTTSTVGGNVTTTTTPGAVVVENASDSGDLASTGFGSSWLLWAGGLLVLAGAAVLVLLRIRRNA